MPNYLPNAQTVDATPQDVYLGVSIEPDALCRVPVYVFASDHAGNVAFWRFDVTARRINEGPLAIAPVATLSHVNTPGASTWLASVVVVNGVLYVRITGPIAAVVDWLATNDDAFCMVGPFGGF